MANPSCGIVMREQVEVHLVRVATALRSNYLAILTGALIAIAALFLSCVILSNAFSSVQRYYALLPARAKAKTSDETSRKRQKKGGSDDDVVYPDEAKAAAAGAASNLQSSDNSRIRASIARLKKRYTKYNQLALVYADAHAGLDANLMDEKILSRAHDDYLPKSDRYTSLNGGAMDRTN